MKGGSAGIQIKTDDTFPLAFTVPVLVTSHLKLAFRLTRSDTKALLALLNAAA